MQVIELKAILGRRQNPLILPVPHVAPVAQGIEQRISTPRVGGSNPSGRATLFRVLTEHIGDGMDPPAFPSAEVAGRSLHRGIPLEEEQRWLSQRR